MMSTIITLLANTSLIVLTCVFLTWSRQLCGHDVHFQILTIIHDCFKNSISLLNGEGWGCLPKRVQFLVVRSNTT